MVNTYDTTRHITAAERNAWNNKAGTGDIQQSLQQANQYTDAEFASAETRSNQYTDGKIDTPIVNRRYSASNR